MGLTRLREAFNTSWWAVPSLVVAGFVAIGITALVLDRQLSTIPDALAFRADAGGARQVLATMASSVLTFTGLTFSITVVVLTLASGQFSPRVLRTFLRDRPSQLALGIFVGTYVVSLLTLREVRGGDADNFVPGLSITVAFLMTAVSIGMFVFFVHHIAQSIRVATIIEQVAKAGRQTIERCYPRDREPTRGHVGDLPVTHVAPATRPGVIIGIEEAKLLRLAGRLDCVLRVPHRIGEFVPAGGTLVEVLGAGGEDVPRQQLANAVTLGRERSEREDIGFVLRQLVDIAERALSPGVNDPTTAVQALNQVYDLLRRLADRPFPSGRHVGGDERIRLLQPQYGYEDLVALGFDEIRHWGADSIQLQGRLRQILDELADAIGDPDRHAAVVRQRRLLDERLEQELPTAEQRTPGRHDDDTDAAQPGRSNPEQ